MNTTDGKYDIKLTVFYNNRLDFKPEYSLAEKQKTGISAIILINIFLIF